MRKSGSRRLSGSGVGLRAKRLGSGARSPTALRTLDQKRSGVAENLEGSSMGRAPNQFEAGASEGFPDAALRRKADQAP